MQRLLISAMLGMAMAVGMAAAKESSIAAGADAGSAVVTELPQPAAFASCISCHSVVRGAVTFGPNLRGVVGRPAGSLDGYSYSEAMKAANFTWDADRLDAWITNPKHVVTGTKMPFPGIKYPERRQDIIAYLSSLK